MRRRVSKRGVIVLIVVLLFLLTREGVCQKYELLIESNYPAYVSAFKTTQARYINAGVKASKAERKAYKYVVDVLVYRDNKARKDSSYRAFVRRHAGTCWHACHHSVNTGLTSQSVSDYQPRNATYVVRPYLSTVPSYLIIER